MAEIRIDLPDFLKMKRQRLLETLNGLLKDRPGDIGRLFRIEVSGMKRADGEMTNLELLNRLMVELDLKPIQAIYESNDAENKWIFRGFV